VATTSLQLDRRLDGQAAAGVVTVGIRCWTTTIDL
jgi:hypothetical protein